MALRRTLQRRFAPKPTDKKPDYQYENIKPDGPQIEPKKAEVGRNTTEDRMIDALDELDLFRSLQPDLREALRTKNIKRMLAGASPWALAKLVWLAETSGSDSAKVAALKDILDRAGYGAVQKQAVMSVDGMTPQELEARVQSNLKELKLLEKKTEDK